MLREAKADTINVPLNSVYFIFAKGIKPSILKSFIYLKFYYPDRFIITDFFFEEWSKIMGCSTKTSKKHFEILLELNYLGFDHSNKRVHVRSIYYLPNNANECNLSVKVSLTDLMNIIPFIVAAIIAYRVRVYQSKLKTRPDLKNDGSLQGLVSRGKLFRQYAPIAITYLSKIINRSPAWVEKYKKQAIALGYIKAKSDRIEPHHSWDSRKFLYDQSLFGRMRKVNGEITLVTTDLLTSYVQLVKRKKSV